MLIFVLTLTNKFPKLQDTKLKDELRFKTDIFTSTIKFQLLALKFNSFHTEYHIYIYICGLSIKLLNYNKFNMSIYRI